MEPCTCLILGALFGACCKAAAAGAGGAAALATKCGAGAAGVSGCAPSIAGIAKGAAIGGLTGGVEGALKGAALGGIADLSSCFLPAAEPLVKMVDLGNALRDVTLNKSILPKTDPSPESRSHRCRTPRTGMPQARPPGRRRAAQRTPRPSF